jgi:hypothetical protein
MEFWSNVGKKKTGDRRQHKRMEEWNDGIME